MNLKSIITADLTQLERKYGEAVSASKRTAAQMDAAFRASPRLDAAQLSAGMSTAAGQIKQSNNIIRESVESVSSEIIESFGIDGDVANMLANEMVKLKASTLIAGGAIAGLVIGVGFLTAAMTEAGAEIRNISQLTGLSTDQVQRYQAAASAAGVATDVFTDAITRLRDRAKEANRGNLEVAAAFSALGVSAEAAAKNSAPAFERLLDVLQTVPDAQTRITIAQRLLGDVNDQTLSGILALTDASGEMRKQVDGLSIALDKQSVESLAKLNREWDLFTTKLGIFGKQVGLEVVNAVAYLNKGFSDMDNAFRNTGNATDQFAQKQGQAAGTIQSTTGAVNTQSEAVRRLSQELDSLKFEGMQKSLDEQLKQIALKAKDAKGAADFFRQGMAMGGDFATQVTEDRRVAKNMEALQKLRRGETDRPKRSGGGRAKEISELAQLQKQLAEVNKDLTGFQNFSSKEFILRMQLEGAREFKSQLEALLKLRRELGEPVAVRFPADSNEAQREIERLNALKTARDALAKQDPTAGLRAKAQADAEAMHRTLSAFEEVNRELRLLGADEVAQTGIEIGEKFAEAMAEAIRLGRTDIVEAINEITDGARRQAANARDTRRAREATGIAEANLEQERTRIQNELNAGILTELEARRRQIEAEQNARTAILQSLEAERALATARGDAAEAARLAVEIERARGLGIDGSRAARMEQFKDRLGQDFDDIIGIFMRGGDGFKQAALNVVNDIFNQLIENIISKASGGSASSIGGLIGNAIGGLFGGLFGGGRAAGGPVTAGVPYLIGEQGPELFVPQASGRIIDAGQTARMTAGSTTVVNAPVTFHITAPGGQISRETQNQIAAKTALAITHASQRNN